MDKQLIIKTKNIFNNKSLNPNSIRILLDKNLDLKQELEIEFNKKPKIYLTLGKLVCLIVKDIELAKCIVCGKEVNYNTTTNGKDRKFCSNKCKLSKKGNPFAQQDIQEKIKQSNLENYGVDNPAKSEIIKEKSKQTCLNKYGVENVFQAEEKKEKIKNTMFKKYGSSNIYGNKKLREKALFSKKLEVYNRILEHYKDKYIPLFSINEYKGVKHYYKWQCVKCGNIFIAQYNNGNICSRCFNCYPRVTITRSKYEDEIVDFLKELNLKVEENDRKTIWPKELDIIIPDKKLAIEFNGSYWHSDKVKKDFNYHLNKYIKCKEKGYQLLTIWEHEWTNNIKKQIIKNKIKEALNIQDNKIQNVVIKEIDTKEKNIFLNNYHIKGQDNSCIKLGLYENDILQSVITFNKSKFNKNYEYELSRFAIKEYKQEYIKILLDYFEKKYKPKSMIIYEDLCYSNGNRFIELGFKIKNMSKPNYVWVLDNNVCPKYKVKKLLKDVDLNNQLKDDENMKNIGYHKIFNCGNLILEKIYEYN